MHKAFNTFTFIYVGSKWSPEYRLFSFNVISKNFILSPSFDLSWLVFFLLYEESFQGIKEETISIKTILYDFFLSFLQ